MQRLLLLALAGALGTLARYGLSTLIYTVLGRAFPWGTLVVNVLGCLVFGVVMQAGLATTVISPEARLIITVGFLGAFTTFSTFSYETLTALMGGQFVVPLLNIAASVFVGLAAVWFGATLAKAIWGGA